MSESKPKPLPKQSHTSNLVKNLIKNKPKPTSAVHRMADPRKTFLPNRRENRQKDANVKRDKKLHIISKSSHKIRPYNNNYKKKIYASKSNKNFIQNVRNNLNIYNTEKNDLRNTNKNVMKSQSNFKVVINRDTIGKKMIREEIAKEKKMCNEKIKIIKAHILSLQKKEEELVKKVVILNHKENALGKSDIEKEESDDNFDNDNEKRHNYSERKIFENEKDKILEKEKELEREKERNLSEKIIQEQEKQINDKDNEKHINNEFEKNNISSVKKEDEKDNNEKERKSTNKTDIEKRKVKGKNEKIKNMKNIKLSKKSEKTPEKKIKTPNNVKTNTSVEMKKNTKTKDIKSNKK